MIRRAIRPIDNSALIIFRIFFGLLFACESFGAIATGWVRDNLVEVKMTFSFIHMDFLQQLIGTPMYGYFALMGIASIGVMLGYRYRLSIIVLTFLWAGAYFMQKTSYNNHYYLLLIISFFMAFLPANDYCSLDVKYNKHPMRLWMPRYVSYLLIAQITIVYFYGTLAKFYPDWLDGSFISLMYSYSDIPAYFKQIFVQKWFCVTIAYAGIIFDGLIIPLLLYKRTRNYALVAALVFHLFNSITLQIGVFPYFALSFAVFFYPSTVIRKVFFKNKPALDISETSLSTSYLKAWQLYIIGGMFVLQVFLPLRSHIFKSDLLWSDQGHRLSWRMMLRSRAGYTYFIVKDNATQQESYYDLNKLLTSKQQARLNTPDMIWQMAQKIKQEYALEGIDVSVFGHCHVSINNRPYANFIDNNVDLAQEEWDYFWPATWVLDKPKDF